MHYLLLLTVVSLAVVCTFAEQVRGQEDAPRQHPYLYFTADELPALRKKLETEPFAGRWQTLLAGAEEVMNTPAGNLTRRAASRHALGNTGLCAFAYAITGEERYAQRALEEMEPWFAADAWHEKRSYNKGADLPSAELSLAAALLYDWCYDAFDDPTRQRIRERTVELGIKPYLASVEVHNDWWVENPVSNWNGVCHGGSGVAALALMHESPEARRACELARSHLVEFVDHIVGVDGGGHEGIMYWHYGSEFSHYFLTAAQHALPGEDIEQLFTATTDRMIGYWPIAMRAPDGYYANFNNMNVPSRPDGARPPRRGGANGPLSALFERNFHEWSDDSSSTTDPLLLWSGDTGGHPYYFRNASPFWFIWRREAPPVDNPPELPDSMLFRTAGHTVWRTPDLFFAYNSGWTSNRSHNNRDLGTFILVYKGERFIFDAGKGFGDTSQHSTVLVDGMEQQKDVRADHFAWKATDDWRYMGSDLSQCYVEPIERLRRHVLLVDGQIVLVDEMADTQPRALEARLQSAMPIEVTENGALITGQQSVLHAVNATPELTRETVDTAPGRGVRGVVMAAKPAESQVLVTLLSPGSTGSDAPTVTLTRDGTSARLEIVNGDATSTADFDTTGPWRLQRVNGEEVGDTTPPDERTHERFTVAGN